MTTPAIHHIAGRDIRHIGDGGDGSLCFAGVFTLALLGGEALAEMVFLKKTLSGGLSIS
jgi:hypothetical protein